MITLYSKFDCVYINSYKKVECYLTIINDNFVDDVIHFKQAIKITIDETR
jgi:hypothetical protein